MWIGSASMNARAILIQVVNQYLIASCNERDQVWCYWNWSSLCWKGCVAGGAKARAIVLLQHFHQYFVKGLVFSHGVWFLCHGIITHAAYLHIILKLKTALGFSVAKIVCKLNAMHTGKLVWLFFHFCKNSAFLLWCLLLYGYCVSCIFYSL